MGGQPLPCQSCPTAHTLPNPSRSVYIRVSMCMCVCVKLFNVPDMWEPYAKTPYLFPALHSPLVTSTYSKLASSGGSLPLVLLSFSAAFLLLWKHKEGSQQVRGMKRSSTGSWTHSLWCCLPSSGTFMVTQSTVSRHRSQLGSSHTSLQCVCTVPSVGICTAPRAPLSALFYHLKSLYWTLLKLSRLE